MDLVCRVGVMPRPGQTITGSHFSTIPGGKGANQAIAAARLGGDVHMIARVGDDDFGQRLINGLDGNGVNTAHVTVTEGTPSGCALILVDRKGENSIVVVPGANARLTPADVDRAESLIRRAACVVMQLEIPLATVKHALGLCQKHGVFSILDPAPVPKERLPRALYGVDLFTPNETESELLLGQTPTARRSSKSVSDPKQIGMELLSRGARRVVLKLGRKGSMVLDRTGLMQRAPGFKVKVVDTTAAGDAFTAGLAVAHAQGIAAGEALRFANAAGAICCTRFGAQPSLPTRDEVDRLLRRGGQQV